MYLYSRYHTIYIHACMHTYKRSYMYIYKYSLLKHTGLSLDKAENIKNIIIKIVEIIINQFAKG